MVLVQYTTYNIAEKVKHNSASKWSSHLTYFHALLQTKEANVVQVLLQ